MWKFSCVNRRWGRTGQVDLCQQRACRKIQDFEQHLPMNPMRLKTTWLWKIAHLIRLWRASQIEMRAKEKRAENQKEGATQTTGELRSSPLFLSTAFPIYLFIQSFRPWNKRLFLEYDLAGDYRRVDRAARVEQNQVSVLSGCDSAFLVFKA